MLRASRRSSDGDRYGASLLGWAEAAGLWGALSPILPDRCVRSSALQEHVLKADRDPQAVDLAQPLEVGQQEPGDAVPPMLLRRPAAAELLSQ